jgi:hypothetical protein
VIVRGDAEGGHSALLEMITVRARENGVTVTTGEFDQAPSRQNADVLGARPDVEVRLDDVRDDWDALGLLAAVAEDAGEDRKRVSLDHVVTGHKNKVGFGDPDERVPAMYPGMAPVRAADGASPLTTWDGVDRPVVAILDTGIGRHPWFDEPGSVVLRAAYLDGRPIGTYPEEDVDAEREGRRDGEASHLDPYAGHGTFIAGIVHQTCPDAALLPVRVYGGDGTASEWDFARSVERLLEFHLRGLAGVPGHFPVDIVVIASGYYLEHPEDDDDYEGVYRGRLRDLRRAGVLVVVSAGNDGSTRRAFPAGWAPPVRRTNNGVVPADARPVPGLHAAARRCGIQPRWNPGRFQQRRSVDRRGAPRRQCPEFDAYDVRWHRRGQTVGGRLTSFGRSGRLHAWLWHMERNLVLGTPASRSARCGDVR